MRSNTNYPYGTDYSHPNWTLRTPRECKRYPHYVTADNDKIPPVAFLIGIGALAVLMLASFI